jgi:hypothetical protein
MNWISFRNMGMRLRVASDRFEALAARLDVAANGGYA